MHPPVTTRITEVEVDVHSTHYSRHSSVRLKPLIAFTRVCEESSAVGTAATGDVRPNRQRGHSTNSMGEPNGSVYTSDVHHSCVYVVASSVYKPSHTYPTLPTELPIALQVVPGPAPVAVITTPYAISDKSGT